MTRCHICERPCMREVEPACGELPAVTTPDVWTVTMRNGLFADACLSCWMKWPDDHKLWPDVGFGTERDSNSGSPRIETLRVNVP